MVGGSWGVAQRADGGCAVSPHPSAEFKKSFENDSQSSDNINFLKVQWSSRQLPTVRKGWGWARLVLGQGGLQAGRPPLLPVPASHPLACS